MRLCGYVGGCVSSTRPDEARAAVIHSRTFTRPLDSCVWAGLGATCRGRRREILSDSWMLGNPHVRFDERDVETGAMVGPLRHRQTKGAETDMTGLPPPRHIPTLPFSATQPSRRE